MLFSKLLRPGLLLALAVCGLLQAPSLYAKDVQRWAILIGVDDYSNINDLEFCGEDQQAMHAQLIESGFKKENIFLLHDKAKEKRYLPFKSNIEKQLQTILKIVGKDDIIVVAFSGHGVRMDGESYFCPTDADLEKPDTLLPIKFIYEQLRGCNASLKLLVIDACRNDSRPRGSRTPRDPTLGFTKALKDARPPLGVVVLSSCAPGEISHENEKLKHGVFMHYVLEGMQGKADKDSNGKITLGELSLYSGRSTSLFVARTYNDVQRPFLHGELTTNALHYDLFQAVHPDYTLGLKYYLGDGVLMDEDRAYRLFRKAADQGYVLAMAYVGNQYGHGKGVKKDEKEASVGSKKQCLLCINSLKMVIPLRNIITVICTLMDGELSRIMPKRPNGTARQQNKIMQGHKAILVKCTTMAKVSSRTIPKQSSGTAKQPGRITM